MTTLQQLLTDAAIVVAERDIIDHGTIRCLYAEEYVRDICSAEGCDEVGTGTVGDDGLAERLRHIADYKPETFWAADARDLAAAISDLEKQHISADVSDYLDRGEEDELIRLEKLIAVAEKLAAVLA